MTEAEWLTSGDPVPLFEHLDGRTSERKLRLFAVASLTAAGHLDEEGHRRCEVAVRFSDALATIHELRRCWPQLQPPKPTVAPELAYDWAESIVMAERRGYYGGSFPFLDQELLCDLIRDIIGNPFQPAVIDQNWRTPTVVAVARQIYEDDDFSAMPVLADAIQDAGCENTAILNHCREQDDHVRGCWLVDTLLDRK